MKPLVVCLCGSTRFKDEFARQNFNETLAGRIVLSIGCDAKTDAELGLTPEVKVELDELHLRKIDLADMVFVLNVGGYVGESTRNEIAYAILTRKPIRWLDTAAGGRFLEDEAHDLGARIARHHERRGGR